MKTKIPLILIVILFFGCSKAERLRPKDMPKLYHCVIHLMQENVPVTEALVSLRSVSAPVKWTISGSSDETGRVEVFTDGYFRGVPTGEHKVIVTKTETVEPTLPAVMPTNPKEIEKLNRQLEAGTKEYHLITLEFSKEETTPLSVTVQEKDIELNFELGKSVRVLEQRRR